MKTTVEVIDKVKDVDLDPEKLKKHVESLMGEIEQGFCDREPLEKKWKIGVQQYHSALPRTDDYDKGVDCEIDDSSTREFCEMSLARFMNPIFQYRETWTAAPKKPTDFDIAKEFELLADHITYNRGKGAFRAFVEQSFRQSTVYTKSVAKIHFIEEFKYTTKYKHTFAEEGEEEHWEDGYSDEEGARVKKSKEKVTTFIGTKKEVIPTADFGHPVPCPSIDDAPWIWHRLWRTKDQVRRDIDCGLYNKEYDGKPIMQALGSPESEHDPELTMSINDGDKGQDSRKYFEILEVYTTLNDEEVIFWIERKSKVCLKAVYNWRDEYPRPFECFSYEAVLNDIDGISLCYILEPGHRALSAILCQRLDASSKSLDTMLFYNEGAVSGDHLKNGKIRGGAIPVNALGKVEENFAQFNLAEPITQIATLEGDIRRHQQKLAGLTDYNAGIEQISRPTAEGQRMLIQEGAQPQYNRMENFRTFLKNCLYKEISYYKQHFPQGLDFYLQENDNPELTHAIINWPDDYWQNRVVIETAVSSQTMNQDMRKQEMVDSLDRAAKIFEQVIMLSQQALQLGPDASLMKRLLDEYLTGVVTPMLKEFSIPMDLNVSEEVAIGDQINELQQQMEEMNAALAEKDTQLSQLQQMSEELQQLTGDIVKEYVAVTGRPPMAIGGPVGPAPPQEGAMGQPA
jgi:predicted ATP-grasp superfamily ATP-dependent carboligase